MLTRIGLFILQQFLHIGCLRIVIANGPTHSLKGDPAGPEVTIHLQNYRLFWRILLKPDLAIGEAYMDGSLTIANDDLEQLMALLMANNGHWQKHWLARIGLWVGRACQCVMGNAAGYFSNRHHLVGKPACLCHTKGKTG
ncbi:hypothetical protein N8860_06150 [Alphaproteobacteria bacterium]|nr:hypothetical protein [Alphaproteobacteria bacterium]